jgi:hypothetical protein
MKARLEARMQVVRTAVGYFALPPAALRQAAPSQGPGRERLSFLTPTGSSWT